MSRGRRRTARHFAEPSGLERTSGTTVQGAESVGLMGLVLGLGMFEDILGPQFTEVFVWFWVRSQGLGLLKWIWFWGGFWRNPLD